MKQQSVLFFFLILVFTSFGFAGGAKQCDFELSHKTIEFSYGIHRTQIPEKPIGIQIIKSKFIWLENSINTLATWFLGPSLKLNEVNKVINDFLADDSSSSYFLRLSRAFGYRAQFDKANLAKNIPARGAVIMVANHPRNGAEGIALAGAVAQIRPDTKIAMTVQLENMPGIKEHAIFLDPNGSKKALEFNKAAIKKMAQHLKKEGLLIVFAAGEVSLKDPASKMLPEDSKWKSGVGKLLKMYPNTQVVPVYIGGEASANFYQSQANKKVFQTPSVHVTELLANRGKDFLISFGSPVTGSELLNHYGYRIKEVMKYLRARSYLMSEQSVLKSKQEAAPTRLMSPLNEPQDSDLVFAALNSTGQILVQDKKKSIHVYLINGAQMPSELLRELGLARERSFRTVGEGSGEAMDIDDFDRHYYHIIAFDTGTRKLLGAYRVGRVDQILKTKGLQGVYSFQFFNHRLLLEQYGPQMLEMGRSFVDFEAGPKAIVALDRLWKGITQFIADNPHYRYLIGPVSISNSYSSTSKLLMLKYLEKKMDYEKSNLVQARTILDYKHQFIDDINKVAHRIADLKGLNKMVMDLENRSIPPLLVSYDKLGASYLGFTRDKAFNTIDGLILVDLLSEPARAEAIKQFGDNWMKYYDFHSSPAAN